MTVILWDNSNIMGGMITGHHFSQQDKSEFKELVVIFVAIILLSSSLLPAIPAFAGVSFGTVVILNATNADNTNPQLAANSSSGVYVVWHDATNINFTSSNNNGTSFSVTGSDDGDVTGSTNEGPDPRIASNSTDGVYVVWQDGTDIRFSASSNGGTSFNTANAIDIGNGPSGNDALPDVIASGDNVYVAWREAVDGRYVFSASSNGGTSFNVQSNADLGNTDTADNGATATNGIIRLAANSTTGVYAVLIDDKNVKFVGSGDSGATFSNNATLGIFQTGSENSIFHPDPQIVAKGTNIFVVWQDVNAIKFIRSTDGGINFDTEINLGRAPVGAPSGTPQIVLGTGDNVFVIWSDGVNTSVPPDIKFRHSSDSGATFESEIDLSDTSTINSELPQIAADNDLVYVTWVEEQSASDHDIYFKTSSNNGTSFSTSFQNLGGSGSSDFAENPQLTAKNDKVFLVWSENIAGGSSGSGTIKFVTGTGTPTNVSFNQTQYRLSDTALITVTDSDSNTNAGSQQTISIILNSTTDTSGISVLNLTETGDATGIFTGTATFTSGSGSSTSGSVLNVTTSDTLSATFNNVTGSASIFSRTIAFDSSPYTIDKIAFLTVTDLNSNLTASVETIEVTISSTIAGKSTTLTLTETNATSGIFGGSSDNSLVFMSNHTAFPLDTSFTITQNNSTNVDSGAIGTTSVIVSSDTDPVGATITLTETGNDTSIFTGEATFISGATSGTSVQASTGDFFLINFTGAGTGGTGTLLDRGLITPNSNSSRAAIQIQSSSGASDSVKATFGGVSSALVSVNIQNDDQGGGGGGLVRPTVTLNAVLSVGSAGGGGGGGGIDFSPPSSTLDKIFNYIEIPEYIQEILNEFDPNIPIAPLENEEFDLPLKINQNSYPLGSDRNTIQTETIKIGELVRFEMIFYDNSEMIHASMYLNIRDNQGAHESDTLISYNKYGPLTIIDKNSFFENVNVEATKVGLYKNIVVFEITFAKEMEKSDLIYKSWDIRKFGTQVIVYDAIQISAVNDVIMDPEPGVDGIIMDPEPGVDDIKKVLDIPEWIKNSIEIWSEDKINDDSFIQGIQFLVQEQIIDITMESNVSEVKDTNIRIFEEEKITRVPDWVKDNAGWWVEGLLSDEEFINSIKFLLEKETIMI